MCVEQAGHGEHATPFGVDAVGRALDPEVCRRRVRVADRRRVELEPAKRERHKRRPSPQIMPSKMITRKSAPSGSQFASARTSLLGMGVRPLPIFQPSPEKKITGCRSDDCQSGGLYVTARRFRIILVGR